MAIVVLITYGVIGSLTFVGFLVLIGAGFWFGAAIGSWLGSKVEITAFSVPPDVEEAASTHFSPLTPPPDNPEDRIKQPDEPDTTVPAP